MSEPEPKKPTFVELLDQAIVDLQQYEETRDQQAFDNTLAGLRQARAAAAYLESTVGISPIPATTVDLRSATPLDLVEATLGLLDSIEFQAWRPLLTAEAEITALEGSIANLRVASAMLRPAGEAAPVPIAAAELPAPEPTRHPRLGAMLLSSIGYAKNVAREMHAAYGDQAGDIDDLVTNLEAIHKLAATGPALVRVVLANAEGLFYDRGSCPDQIWATDNPLSARHWPDLATALAALTSPQFERAFAKAQDAKFVLKRIVVAVEDLADWEIEAASEELAYAGRPAPDLAVAG